MVKSATGLFSSSAGRRIAGGALLIALTGILSTAGAFYFAASQIIRRMATDDLTHVVEATFNMVHQAAGQAVVNHLRAKASTNLAVVAQLYAEYRAGRISESQARRLAEKVLLSQHIGQSGYIYCLDSRGIIRVHPKRSLRNSSLAGYDFIQEQIRRKEGYLEYQWKNPGESSARPKALYMIYFRPWDWIISVSTYRDEFNDLVRPQDFREDVLSIKIGETGYLYLIDHAGNALVHPTSEGKNFLDTRDVKGNYFIREMLGKKNGLITYWWKNPGEQAAREKIVVYQYYPDFKWVIGGGAYLDELYHPLGEIRNLILGILVTTCLLALCLSLWFGRGIVTAQNLSEMMLRSSLETAEQIIDSLPFALVLVNAEGRIKRANQAAGVICQVSPRDLIGQKWGTYNAADARAAAEPVETSIVNREGKRTPVLLACIPFVIGNEPTALVAFLDLRERYALERELYQSQKLEAVGRLAAGIAHEINTPTQYVGDNAKFLEEAFAEFLALVREYRAAADGLPASPEKAALLERLRTADEKADLTYLQQNVPAAFSGTQEGIGRIISIVRAMKEFAHPERREKSPADINRALQTTLTIAHNEYKYIAEVETQFGEVPNVMCVISDINQVFLNLLVNAAHAIGDVVGKNGGKGLIRVRTAREGKWVRIEIEDSGAGIPETIRDRIFDPFFTTKQVGKGTGQGLAIARSIVVDKHHGSLTFTSAEGRGTTFVILLPIEMEVPKETENAAVAKI